MKKKVELYCTNWDIGENLLNISCAKEQWVVNGKSGSRNKFACKVGIPYNMFKKYIYKDHSKRRDVRKSAGNPSKITLDIQDVIVDTLYWYDCEKNGKILEEAINLVCSLAPDISRKQCSHILHHLIIP